MESKAELGGYDECDFERTDSEEIGLDEIPEEVEFLRYGTPEEILEEEKAASKPILGEFKRIPFTHNSEGMSAEQIRMILDELFPPKVFMDEDKRFLQRVSGDAGEPGELANSSVELDKMLRARMARTEGVCPIRSPLFFSLFNELIRQEAVSSPERGILLTRIKENHLGTVDLYQKLLEGAQVYSDRHHSRPDVEDLSNLAANLRAEVEELTLLVEELDNEASRKEENIETLRNERAKAREDDLDYHRTENLRLKKTLELVVQVSSAKPKYRRKPGQVQGDASTIFTEEGAKSRPSDLASDRIKSRSKSRKAADSISRILEPAMHSKSNKSQSAFN